MQLVVALTAVFAAASQRTLANATEDALVPFVESGELPGAVSVFQKDGAEEIACVGWADVEAKRPITLDSPFMQCSQTKGFCGVTIAMLVEEGRISLDDPISKYLPEFSEMWVCDGGTDDVRRYVKARTPITVRMVMNHTAGFPFELPHYTLMGGWSRKMPLRSVAIFAASQPILFEPGTSATYSNTGIDIGAAIVEVVTGKRWEDFLRERVLEPLGMTQTTFWPSEEQLANAIELYECAEGAQAMHRLQHESMQRPYNDHFVFASAGAGLWTTARDQLKFYRMLMNLGVADNGTRILQEDTVKTLLATSSRPSGMEGYSLGLNAPVRDSEDAWFGHGGAWGTKCEVNWHKRHLKLWVMQMYGYPRPWEKSRDRAASEFFADNQPATSGVDAYTGRLK